MQVFSTEFISISIGVISLAFALWARRENTRQKEMQAQISQSLSTLTCDLLQKSIHFNEQIESKTRSELIFQIEKYDSFIRSLFIFHYPLFLKRRSRKYIYNYIKSMIKSGQIDNIYLLRLFLAKLPANVRDLEKDEECIKMLSNKEHSKEFPGPSSWTIIHSIN